MTNSERAPFAERKPSARERVARRTLSFRANETCLISEPLSLTHFSRNPTPYILGTPTAAPTQRNDLGGGSARRPAAARGAAAGEWTPMGAAASQGTPAGFTFPSPAPSAPRSVVDPDDVFGTRATQGDVHGDDTGAHAEGSDQRVLVWGTTVEVREDGARFKRFLEFFELPSRPDVAHYHRALVECFERENYQLVCAVDGKEALKQFESQVFDMVLTDVRMPKLSGLELLREIKERSPQTPVVMMTAYGTIDNAVEAMSQVKDVSPLGPI